MSDTLAKDDVVNVRCIVVDGMNSTDRIVLVRPLSKNHGHALYVDMDDVSLLYHSYEVGDVVTTEDFGKAVVVHVHGDSAWCRFEDGNGDAVFALSDLRPHHSDHQDSAA